MKEFHENNSTQASNDVQIMRSRNELLRERLAFLESEDHFLMKMYIENGNSFNQLARVAGVAPGTVSRRINRIINRLTNGEYVICLRNREMFSCQDLSVAKDHYMRGYSMRKIAKRWGLTFYTVRETLNRIECLLGLIKKVKKR